MISSVYYSPCADYEPAKVQAALSDLMEKSGGLSWVRPGMTVAIKANLVSLLRPERAATTHPALLCALTRMLCALGAKVVVGDGPGGLFSAAYVNKIYSSSGMGEAERAGAVLNRNFTERRASFPNGKVLHEFTYTAWLDDADAIINFAKLKTHGMMGMSACVKNMFGTVPGTTKPEYHYRFPDPADFADMLIDLNEYFKPRLNLIDAVVGMEGNGPTSGVPRPIGLILASQSPYALDLTCARLIGLKTADAPTLKAAQARSLAPLSAEDAAGEEIFKRYAVPSFAKAAPHSMTFEGNGWYGKLFGNVAKAALRNRPMVLPNVCAGCGKCARICPANAITMDKNHLPRIDRKKCICCFCCQEFCEKAAMRVHRPLAARMLDLGARSAKDAPDSEEKNG